MEEGVKLDGSEVARVLEGGADEKTTFATLGLPEFLTRVVAELGYEVPTPIQAASIPVLLSGRDLIGQAQTGTGKTAAFALPILAQLSFEDRAPQALVLTPTRELAIQVAEAFRSYSSRDERFHVLPIYGGQSIGVQLRQLDRRPQVIVGTPGRVMDHLRRGSLTLDGLRFLVIDEADEMLSMGFLEDIEWIIEHTPKEKQTTLFSATMPRAIRRVAQAYLIDAEEVIVRHSTTEAPLIDQSFWFVSGLHKLDALTRILEVSEIDAALVFVRTKNAAIELAEKLEARGYAAGPLNGDMTQEARERTIERLKQGRLDILVATDVAARGLDVDRISHVINFDIPYDAETYTHRIGRTGRAGRSGTAILFVSAREQGLLRSIERGTGYRLDRFNMPTYEIMWQRRTDRFMARVAAMLESTELSQFSPIIDELVEKNGSSPEIVASALCAMLHHESPFVADESERGQQKRHAESPRGEADRFSGGDSPRRDRPAREDRGGRDDRDGRKPPRYRDRDREERRPERGARSAPQRTYDQRPAFGRGSDASERPDARTFRKDRPARDAHAGGDRSTGGNRAERRKHLNPDRVSSSRVPDAAAERSIPEARGTTAIEKEIEISKTGAKNLREDGARDGDRRGPRGERPWQKKFGGKPFAEKKFGEKKFGGKKFAGKKKFGSEKFGEKKFGEKRFGDKQFTARTEKPAGKDRPKKRSGKGFGDGAR